MQLRALPWAVAAVVLVGASAPAPADPGDDDDTSGGGEVEEDADATPSTGVVRAGVYSDSDDTRVFRVLGALTSPFGNLSLNGSVGVDAVTSASLDVRTSPELGTVDVITSASGRTSTSGGQMSDTRAQVTAGATWDDTHGHVVSLTAVGARERDYLSAGADLNGSIDLLDRTVTLLGGLSFTRNQIASVLDDTFHRSMYSVGWSLGLSRVMTRNDVVRVRYDGSDSEGYQASPYRNVRFGDWTTTTRTGGQIVFANTIGSADGLPELEPEHRLRHALVVEWLHALGNDVGLHPSLRVTDDSWGVTSATAALELRIARPTWRGQLGYRYYQQRAARFFADKYLMDPGAYPYYTADKDLGDEVGHGVDLGLSRVLIEPDDPGHARVLLDLRLDLLRYRYPGFVLLDQRTSAFVQVGLTWEL